MNLATITEADSIEWLASLPACSVHCIATDPPYCSGDWQESKQMSRLSNGENDDGRSQWFASDSMSTAGLVYLLRAMAHEAHRVLVPGGHLFVCCAWRQEFNIGPAIESTGVRVQNRLIWDKQHPGQGEHFRSQYETVLHFAKGTARKGEDSGKYGNVLPLGRVPWRGRRHPTEKPVELMSILIGVGSLPGELVVDPFAGAGTTGVAARARGRTFAGCDRDPVYAAFARHRIDGEPLPPDLAPAQGSLDLDPAQESDCT